jgi:hypothetical protein
MPPMTATRTVHATAAYEDGQWEIMIPEIGQSTATRNRERIAEYA